MDGKESAPIGAGRTFHSTHLHPPSMPIYKENTMDSDLINEMMRNWNGTTPESEEGVQLMRLVAVLEVGLDNICKRLDELVDAVQDAD